MLRGSYAGGSLAVTARCPVRRSGPSANPAHPRPGSRPARDASRSRFGCCDSQSNAPAIHGFATPSRFGASHCRCMAERSRAFAFRRGSLLLHRHAPHWVASPFRRATLLCSAFPLRCRAGLRRRVILHFKAVARQISEELCLRLATLRYAFAMPCFALPSPRRAPQSQAFAARIGPSPLHAAALLRRRVASLCSAVPWPFLAPHGRATQCRCVSVRCRSFAGPFVSLLLLCQSLHSVALPSPI